MKSIGMEEFLNKTFEFDRRKVIEQDMCAPKPIGCGGPATHFIDALSRKEYSISGLCQNCQDGIFTDPDEEN